MRHSLHGDTYLRGLVKKVCLVPRIFLVVNGSVLKIGMDIHWIFTYTRVDTFTIFFICDIRSKERFGTPEAVLYVCKFLVDQNEVPYNSRTAADN